MTEVETPKFNKSHSLMAGVQQPPNKAVLPATTFWGYLT